MNSRNVALRNNAISSTKAASNQKAYKIGYKALMTKTFCDEDLINYVKATGDSNPIHCNDEHTINKVKGRLVHGMLVGGLISAVLGTKLPGFGAIYVSQTMKFIKPVYVNNSVTARVEITGIDENKKRLLLATTCFNSKGDIVVIGEAVVIPNEWLSN